MIWLLSSYVTEEYQEIVDFKLSTAFCHAGKRTSIFLNCPSLELCSSICEKSKCNSIKECFVGNLVNLRKGRAIHQIKVDFFLHLSHLYQIGKAEIKIILSKYVARHAVRIGFVLTLHPPSDC